MQKRARQLGLAGAVLGLSALCLAGCAKPAPSAVQAPSYNTQQPQVQQADRGTLREAGQLAALANAAARSGDLNRAIGLLQQLRDSLGGAARATSADSQRMAALQSQVDAAIQQIQSAPHNRTEVANVAIAHVIDSINYIGTH